MQEGIDRLLSWGFVDMTILSIVSQQTLLIFAIATAWMGISGGMQNPSELIRPFCAAYIASFST